MSSLDNGRNSYLRRDVDIAKYLDLGVKMLFGHWHWDHTNWDIVTIFSPSSEKIITTIFLSTYHISNEAISCNFAYWIRRFYINVYSTNGAFLVSSPDTLGTTVMPWYPTNNDVIMVVIGESGVSRRTQQIREVKQLFVQSNNVKTDCRVSNG